MDWPISNVYFAAGTVCWVYVHTRC